MKRLLTIFLRLALTLAMVALAGAVGFALWDYYLEAPWTRDGRVRADVVAVAPDVSGLVTDVLVRDNQIVRRGDVLFRIDPERFTLALRQAEAVVAGKEAAAEQSEKDYERYKKLSDTAVSQQRFELAQATAQEAKAAYDQAVADRDVAKLNLERSTVRASVNGRITNMDLRPGAYVTVGIRTRQLAVRSALRRWIILKASVYAKADQRVDQFMRLRDAIEERVSRKFFEGPVETKGPVVLRSNDFLET
jgi:RND family efflux transporter MFP subunit